MSAIAGIIGKVDNAALSRMRDAMKHRGEVNTTPRLTLERDALGHKPLYFARIPGGFIYATELRAILASGLLAEPRIDPIGLASAVWNGFVMSSATMVRGVQSVLPGERVTFDPSGEVSREMTWSMPPAAKQHITD